MSDLMPFASRQLGTETVPTVNARDLHAYLGITKPYADWIRVQIRRAHLAEHRDYVVFHSEVKNLQGGRPASEHHLTFDAAKHVAMMSSADKGHAVREWFIAKEKELAQLTLQSSALPQVHNQALQAIIDMAVQLDRTEQRAILAEATATRAETKADMALAEVRMMTLEDFVLANGLMRQLPQSSWREYARWLTEFCQTYLLDVRKDPVPGRLWESENVYPVTALGALLHYEQTRPRQVTLLRASRHDA
jgi:anti-repressor protein